MKPRALRWLGLLALTGALGGALWVIDQLVVTPPAPPGWQRLAGLDALPATAHVPDPTLLPPTLGWPPRQIWHRIDDGTWLALGEPPRAWLGAWRGDPPAALGALAACLTAGPACPAGWQARSATEASGWRRAVLLRGDGLAADHLFRGLRAGPVVR